MILETTFDISEINDYQFLKFSYLQLSLTNVEIKNYNLRKA
jgi:hypothetical protein